MQYTLNTSNYHTFPVFEVNKLPPRSYFIPYPARPEADAVSLTEKRYRSPKVRCLNGLWDFKFYPRPAELPRQLDTDQIKFATIDVPSCWQFRGYDRPFYTNIRYQFPFRPPQIPTIGKVDRVFSWMGVDQKISLRYKDPGEEYNFVGVYRRFLTVDDPEKRFTLSFLGVASCLDLYVNGLFVGYSEGAHNTAEFDLSGKLHTGRNELLVVVHRWCNGTYLEDQDMFRNNGIFRDVLLRIDEPADFWDLDADARKTGDTLLYRAPTDNDTDALFRNTMASYADQRETLVSCEATANGYRVVTRVTNRKARFLVTDTYEGASDGILVTSSIHCERGGGTLPRFGKCFCLDESFDQVDYTGRTGESYCDMKEQFPIGRVQCRVSDMTEPNIRPQESGNRCDCVTAAFSDGRVTVTFTAMEKPFELGVKPYTDRALLGMSHRGDEVRTGTFVTVQAFQQGIGTGACGPAIAPEFLYDARRDYRLRFLIRVAPTCQLE